jgi:hypothetical protein
MGKYTKNLLLMAILLLFYSFGVATSIVSIAFDVSYMLELGRIEFGRLFSIFVQVL